jgi:hypothetical protein
MGCCRLASGSTYAGNEQQCAQLGAFDSTQYDENPCTTNCAFISRLANYLNDNAGHDDVVIYATWSSFDFLYDFRDEVLKQCKTGKRVLELYKTYADRAGAIIDRDKKLLFETLRLLLLGILFARRVVIAKYRRKSRLSIDKPLDPDVLDRALKVLQQLRQRAPEHEFDEPIAFAEALLNRIRGLKPAQVWTLLQKTPKAALAQPRSR